MLGPYNEVFGISALLFVYDSFWMYCTVLLHMHGLISVIFLIGVLLF